jgi:hypothetical protein
MKTDTSERGLETRILPLRFGLSSSRAGFIGLDENLRLDAGILAGCHYEIKIRIPGRFAHLYEYVLEPDGSSDLVPCLGEWLVGGSPKHDREAVVGACVRGSGR